MSCLSRSILAMMVLVWIRPACIHIEAQTLEVDEPNDHSTKTCSPRITALP